MEIFEAINTRKSVRKYTDEQVPLEDIRKIIDAAHRAPSATNSQMWEFIVVYNSAIKSDIKDVITQKYDEMLTWDEAQDKIERISMYKNYSTFFADAPVVIAVVQKPKSSFMEDLLKERGVEDKKINRCRPDGALLSIGAAIENLSLAAHALGYGTCWLTAPLYAYKELEQILKIQAPDKLVSFMCLGIPLNKNQDVTPKKDLDEVLKVIE